MPIVAVPQLVKQVAYSESTAAVRALQDAAPINAVTNVLGTGIGVSCLLVATCSCEASELWASDSTHAAFPPKKSQSGK